MHGCGCFVDNVLAVHYLVLAAADEVGRLVGIHHEEIAETPR